jgi:hypothetical protein
MVSPGVRMKRLRSGYHPSTHVPRERGEVKEQTENPVVMRRNEDGEDENTSADDNRMTSPT